MNTPPTPAASEGALFNSLIKILKNLLYAHARAAEDQYDIAIRILNPIYFFHLLEFSLYYKYSY
jgi:hypothetical protein